MKIKKSMSKKQISLKKIEAIERRKLIKKGRKLTSKQYKSLMKKAKEELGINNLTHTILDVNRVSKPKELIEALLNLVIALKGDSVYKECLKMLKRCDKEGDKYSVLAYYLNLSDKPFVLMSESERSNKTIRSFKKRNQNIYQATIADLFDDNLIKALEGKPRKFDSFDKLDNDTRIQWARDAYCMLGDLYISVLDMLSERKLYGELESEVIVNIMKEACRINKIPSFKGKFANPYWVCFRVGAHKNLPKTNEVNKTDKLKNKGMDIIKKASGIDNSNKTLPIIDGGKAIEKIIPFLKKMKLYNEFKVKKQLIPHIKPRSELQIISELLKR